MGSEMCIRDSLSHDGQLLPGQTSRAGKNWRPGSWYDMLNAVNGAELSYLDTKISGKESRISSILLSRGEWRPQTS